MKKQFWSLALVVCAVALAVLGLGEFRDSKPVDNPGAVASPAPTPTRIPFAVGQVWRYKTRPGEEKSRLTIIKVETLGGHSMVHIALSNLVFKLDGQPMSECSHLPFSEQAIRESVLVLEGATQGDIELGGYNDWRAAFDAGKAGVFTDPVDKTVDAMAQGEHGRD